MKHEEASPPESMAIRFEDVVSGQFDAEDMPGAVPRTSTYALTNVTLPYALAIANKGIEQAVRDDPAIALGVNTWDGAVTNEGVAAATGMAFASLDSVLE